MSQYIVTRDFTKTLAQMIEPGRYDVVHPYIREENFPPVAADLLNDEVEVFLVHLDRRSSDEEVDAEMEHRGLRDISLLEGLPLGAKYPRLQRQFPIIMRGSSYTPREGYRYFVTLEGDDHERILGVFGGFPVYNWDSRWRFAGIRKT